MYVHLLPACLGTVAWVSAAASPCHT